MWLYNDEHELEQFFESHQLPFTTLTASPFMALFATIVELDVAMRVLDRVILDKSQALTNIMKHVLP